MARTLPRSTVAVAAAALLVAAATGLILQGVRDDVASELPPRCALQWRAQDQLAYQLQIDSAVAFSAEAEPVQYRLRARLYLRVLSGDAGIADVAVQLGGVDYLYGAERQPAREAALGVPFVVHFEGGLPARFEFPPALDAEIQDHLREVLRTFQATSPPDGQERWSVVEEDANGPFRASYECDRSGAWRRQKVAYLGEVAARPGQVIVLHSDAVLRPAAAHSWWQGAEVREQLEVRSNGNVVARLATEARLLPAAWDAGSELASGQLAVEELLRRPVPVLAAPTPLAPVTTRVATAADRAALQELLAAYAAGNGKDSSLIRRLAALLCEVPELALDLHPVLVDAGQLAAVGAGIAHALELAGTAESQFVLVTVGGATTVDARLRQRALIALGGVQAPTSDSIRMLWQIGQSRGGGVTDETACTALLALGNLGRKLSGQGGEEYARIAEGLWQVAAQSPEPERRAVALKAMANTGDGRNGPIAAQALTDPVPMVRAAAVAPLALLDDATTLDLFTERLRTEPEGRVRAALASGMRSMASTSPAAFAACAEQLGREQQPEARGALAFYLADHLADYPEGRTVLEDLLRRETRRDVVRYVAGRVHRTANH